MSTTNITDIRKNLIQGKGVIRPIISATNGTVTAATATSGFFTHSINPNGIGTTVPSTIVDFKLSPTTASLSGVQMIGTNSTGNSGFLARLYQIGTFVVNTATFTHSGTFTRLRRTVLGTANTPIPLIPIYYVTTAVSGAASAPTFTFTYVDQDGNTGETSITNTMGGTAVNAQSCFAMMPKTSDSAVLDITAMSITANGATAGACTVYGMEILATQSTASSIGLLSNQDLIYGGLNLPELQPATPDSGSVTSLLTWVYKSQLGTAVNPTTLIGSINA